MKEKQPRKVSVKKQQRKLKLVEEQKQELIRKADKAELRFIKLRKKLKHPKQSCQPVLRARLGKLARQVGYKSIRSYGIAVDRI